MLLREGSNELRQDKLIDLSSVADSFERIALPEEPSPIKNSKPLDFFDFSFEELCTLLNERFNLPRFRAVQLFQWIYRRQLLNISEMTDIAKDVRSKFDEVFSLKLPIIKSRQISSDGTRKYLMEVDRGDLIESVMIKQPNRMTLCVSSQVGCAMKCAFCRTGTMGLKRNLRTSEIIGQVLNVILDARNFGDMFSNIVFMGMGEPLHNFNNVVRAIKILNNEHGLQLSGRKITVSSVGLVSSIKKFSQSEAKASIAISLNATTNEVRSKIMPINDRFSLEELIQCVKELPKGKRDKITIEYVMLSGINDTREDLGRLSKILRGLAVKVNLIPYNENAGLGFRSPATDWVHHWQQSLYRSGLQTTIRWSKGKDIDAACGQLATQQDLRQ